LRCAVTLPSLKPSSLTDCSANSSATGGGHNSPPRAVTCNVRCGHRRRPRARPCPTPLYVDSLIGPDTVNTLPEPTITAFEDHGTVQRTIDSRVDDAADVMDKLAGIGVDMDDVGSTLEDQGVASFHDSFAHMLAALDTKARQLAGR
jgi:hypothetical protein